jgi:3-oxoacyl-[acyl-carrier protein] reductase
VNCIHPSVVETDRTRRRIKAEIERTGRSEKDIRDDIIREFNNTIRFGTVEDVGNLVTFIVSSRASWLHGTTIDLDGGEIPVL